MWWHVLFLYGHGQISNLLYDKIISTCGMAYLKQGGTQPAGCAAALKSVAVEAGGYFAYGLYDDCIYEEGLMMATSSLQTAASTSSSPGGVSRRGGRKALPSPTLLAALGFAPNGQPLAAERGALTIGGAVNDYACGGGDAQTIWTNQTAVRTALHVPLDSLFFNGDSTPLPCHPPSRGRAPPRPFATLSPCV